jgi:DNA-binding XRE family transcriptional regulator
MIEETGDPKWDRIWRKLEVGMKRQALIRIANELPEGQGKAIRDQPPEVKTPQVQFVTQLILARKRQKISQAELAKRINSSQKTIARIESGESSPTLNMVYKIVTALGLKVTLTE